MAALLAFPPPSARAPAPCAFDEGHSAAILFFTGVRYVRLDADADAPAVKKRRRGPRAKKAEAERLAQA